MKSQRGITLVSLVIYIIVMSIVLIVMNSIIANFYNNTESTKASVEEMVEFNKFNNFLLKEVKLPQNGVDKIEKDNEQNYILFTTGNSFSMYNNSIYYNNIKICNNVKDMTIKKGEDGDGKDETIINVTLDFENFSKTMNYKIENIY